ncbi:MAG TPA: translation initiation factor IF-1 [Candidatus Paceibacterota bacterium]
MTVEGLIVEALPGFSFKVKLDEGREIIAYVSGKMRLRRIRVLLGDRVKIELPDARAERGRIVWRF